MSRKQPARTKGPRPHLSEGTALLKSELLKIRQATSLAKALYANDPKSATAECAYAYACGICRQVAERLLALLEATE